MSWREARTLRGLTYLLTPVNWNAGTAGILVYLRQVKGVGMVEAGGSMMLYGAVDGDQGDLRGVPSGRLGGLGDLPLDSREVVGEPFDIECGFHDIGHAQKLALPVTVRNARRFAWQMSSRPDCAPPARSNGRDGRRGPRPSPADNRQVPGRARR